MTPEQQRSLERLLGRQMTDAEAREVAPHVVRRNLDAIAAVLSVGRVKRNGMQIGNGTVLATLGLTKGNALLDVLYGQSDFRHVKPLLEQGRLIVSEPIVQAAIQSFVPALLTQAEADSLKHLGFDPDPLTGAQVAAALDGSI